MEESFNYKETLETLEKIALKVEDPSTSIDDMDLYLSKSSELINACRNYLRSVREKLDSSFD